MSKTAQRRLDSAECYRNIWEKILQNLSQVAQQTTRIIVSHRVSVARNADYILFLDQGQLIGEGTHTKLYQENEQYRNYYDTQVVE